MFIRSYKISEWISNESFFLFGPRQTGKTTELLREFPHALFVDLLRPSLVRELERRPESLDEMILQYLAKAPANPIVVVDEVQKVPALLDVVHSQIFQSDSKDLNLRFILTGSSPRKLLRAGQNLLGGRVGWRTFWPLTFCESHSDPKIVPTLRELVQWGGIPSVIKSTQRKGQLRRYIDLYLDQEIRSEGVTRNLPKFSRFLEIAALATGQQVSMRGLSSDVGLSETTVAAWFGILEETLIGHLLPCFQKTSKRKAMTSRKFYYFDTGLANAILSRFSLTESTPEFGVATENYLFQNLMVYCARHPETNMKLHYWRSIDHEEVDFIVTSDGEPTWAIEVKSGDKPKERDFSGLNAFGEDYPNVRKTLVARVSTPRLREDRIEILPIEDFLTEIG